ncbi:MAG: hypothetical protein CL841_03735 [Crocinitomicaceae bacterium]|nr:hypothetical protein [Crocinitomicaceae bacterium]
MKKFLLSISIIAIFGISATVRSLDLIDNYIKKKDNISRINDEKFTDNENENISQEVNFENSSEILDN